MDQPNINDPVNDDDDEADVNINAEDVQQVI